MTDSQKNLHPYPSRNTQVIYVEGSDIEMGRQHAEQLGEIVQLGMAPFYYGFFKRILNPKELNPLEKAIYQCLAKGVDALCVPSLVSRIPLHLRERVRGVSEVSQIPEKNFLTTLVLPDLLPMLQAHWIKLNPRLGIPVVEPPRFGCSSFIANGNRFLHGRNLDFPGVAYWDRYPVLQITKPKEGLKYLGITSAGVPLAGISGVNEAGITVSLHQHYALQTDWKGVLPFVLSERILSEADSLEKAVEILKSSRIASSWAFVVADGKTKNGFIFEANPRKYGVRWLADEGNVLSHSNFFQSKDLKNSDYATTERMNWDNFWRKQTLDQSIRKQLDSLSPEYAVQCLSDHTDGFWNEEKVVNRTVSQVYNIQSYVIDPVQMKLYLAEGDCPIHLRGYQEYNLGDLFNGKTHNSGKILSPYQFKNEANRKAKEEYILSFVAAFDEDFSEALSG
ncbi:MAG: C45 family autoproteolytic acyltransferase/hydrolase, partial [Pseudomonadota bacterium]